VQAAHIQATLDQLDLWTDDPVAFISQCLIIDKRGRPIRLTPNKAQAKVLTELARSPQGARVLILKARQLGSTTICVLFLLWLALFRPNTRVAIVAHLDRSAFQINEIITNAYKALPDWITKSKVFGTKTTSGGLKFHHGSVFRVGTANSEFWRSTSFQAVLASECAYYDSLPRTMASIFSALSQDGFSILESTANGPNEFHRLWKDPYSGYSKIFLSWTDDPTCTSEYPPEPPPNAREQKYIAHNNLTPGQANYYVNSLRSKYGGNQQLFDQEMPANPQLAFILGGDRFFSTGFFPPDTRHIPALQIHQPPRRGSRYILGADPAGGSKEGDRSAFVLLDVTDPHKLFTVATFADRLPIREFANTIADVAMKYFNCTVIVERNAGWGLSVIDQLKTRKTPLYRSRVYDSTTAKYSDIYGFTTTGTSRPLILGALQEAVDQGYWKLNDPRLEEEANAFRYDQATRKPQAQAGCHDDLILAAALALHGAPQARNTTAPVATPTLHADASLREQLEWEMKTGELTDDDSPDLD